MRDKLESSEGSGRLSGCRGAVMNEAALDAMDIGSISAGSLMFQTGYLTIGRIERQIDRLARYALITPNLEVRAAFSQLTRGKESEMEI